MSILEPLINPKQLSDINYIFTLKLLRLTQIEQEGKCLGWHKTSVLAGSNISSNNSGEYTFPGYIYLFSSSYYQRNYMIYLVFS